MSLVIVLLGAMSLPATASSGEDDKVPQVSIPTTPSIEPLSNGGRGYDVTIEWAEYDRPMWEL